MEERRKLGLALCALALACTVALALAILLYYVSAPCPELECRAPPPCPPPRCPWTEPCDHHEALVDGLCLYFSREALVYSAAALQCGVRNMRLANLDTQAQVLLVGRLAERHWLHEQSRVALVRFGGARCHFPRDTQGLVYSAHTCDHLDADQPLFFACSRPARQGT